MSRTARPAKHDRTLFPENGRWSTWAGFDWRLRHYLLSLDDNSLSDEALLTKDGASQAEKRMAKVREPERLCLCWVCWEPHCPATIGLIEQGRNLRPGSSRYWPSLFEPPNSQALNINNESRSYLRKQHVNWIKHTVKYRLCTSPWRLCHWFQSRWDLAKLLRKRGSL